jgi:hypothetical protein
MTMSRKSRSSSGTVTGISPASRCRVPLVPDPVHPLPGAAGNQVGRSGRGHGAARTGADDVVRADRQHIAHPALADAPAQLAAAVDLVAGHERGADPQGVRAVQQDIGQLRLGGEQHLLRDAGQLAVLLIGGAAFGRYSARPISVCPRPVA